ncbi:hypothetical protein BDZ89DRAFT_1052680 [Hymenopellis radicata]|nr:hypothetical protein BDZ89DRAFT_1052680 [Hymenopellis radicata]
MKRKKRHVQNLPRRSPADDEAARIIHRPALQARYDAKSSPAKSAPRSIDADPESSIRTKITDLKSYDAAIVAGLKSSDGWYCNRFQPVHVGPTKNRQTFGPSTATGWDRQPVLQ